MKKIVIILLISLLNINIHAQEYIIKCNSACVTVNNKQECNYNQGYKFYFDLNIDILKIDWQLGGNLSTYKILDYYKYKNDSKIYFKVKTANKEIIILSFDKDKKDLFMHLDKTTTIHFKITSLIKKE